MIDLTETNPDGDRWWVTTNKVHAQHRWLRFTSLDEIMRIVATMNEFERSMLSLHKSRQIHHHLWSATLADDSVYHYSANVILWGKSTQKPSWW